MISAKRTELLDIAKTWLLTPFHHEARVKGHGVDCLQLIIGVYQEAGLLPADIDKDVYPYAYDAHLHDPEEQYIAALESHGWIEVDQPHMGDVVLIKVGRRYSHGAIAIDYPLCIHSYIGLGVCYVDAIEDADIGANKRKFYTMFGKSA